MAPDGNLRESADSIFDGLSATNRERLSLALREHVPETFRLNRVIEQKTGYTSEICKNMMIDVLSHIGTLASQQHVLDEEQQASQLAKIEEHLRRAIVEHPEQVLRDRILEVEGFWVEYQKTAFRFRENNELHDVPRHEELEALRHRIDARLEAARKTKPNETTWEESLDAAAQVTEAADLARELADKLHQCIGKANQLIQAEERRERERTETNRRWIVGIIVSIVLAVLTAIAGYVVGNNSDSQSSPVTPTAPKGK
jgi:hypothetical protein